jgi:hypothetical protein
MFHFDPNATVAGTSLVEEIDLPPAFLVERFGPPLPGDGSRCTGRYGFVDDGGEVFTVYEYKSTAAYLDDEDDALPPEEFWRSELEQELSVGGRGDYGDGSAKAFIEWLSAEYRRWRADKNHAP